LKAGSSNILHLYFKLSNGSRCLWYRLKYHLNLLCDVQLDRNPLRTDLILQGEIFQFATAQHTP